SPSAAAMPTSAATMCANLVAPRPIAISGTVVLSALMPAAGGTATATLAGTSCRDMGMSCTAIQGRTAACGCCGATTARAEGIASGSALSATACLESFWRRDMRLPTKFAGRRRIDAGPFVLKTWSRTLRVIERDHVSATNDGLPRNQRRMIMTYVDG